MLTGERQASEVLSWWRWLCCWRPECVDSARMGGGVYAAAVLLRLLWLRKVSCC